MNTIFFKYAIEVERTRSISKAAENLMMAQPNLSKAIRELEDGLGFLVFNRSSKGVTPTPKGIEFLALAKTISFQLAKINALSKPKNSLPSLNVSIPKGSYIARAFVNTAKRMNPEGGMDFRLQEADAMETIESIGDCRFDLGVIRYPIAYELYFMDFLKDKQISHEPIWEFEYQVLLAKKNPLSACTQIEIGDLENMTEIIRSDMGAPYLTDSQKENVRFPGSGRRKIHLYERSNQLELLCHLPDAYMWASPLPDGDLDRYELVQKKCQHPIGRYRDVLIYAADYEFSELDRSFIRELHIVKSRLVQRDFSS